MISEHTRMRLEAAISDSASYCSGAKRKQLQVAYDKMLDELSIKLFGEPCTNRMVFRQKINSTDSDSPVVNALKSMLRNQEKLFRKDYCDHADEIQSFLTNDISHFLMALSNERE